MPYVSKNLLRSAIAALNHQYSPLLIVSLPCMLRHGIPTCASSKEAESSGIEFGATNEREWLDRYFRIDGAPPGKPYFMPVTREWVQERYADRSLQRRRKDFESSVFHHPTRSTWALRPDAAKELAAGPNHGKGLIPLWALMVWMWRYEELGNIEDSLRDFVDSMGFARDDLIGTVYSDQIPPEISELELAEAPIEVGELAELVGAVRPPPEAPPIDNLVDRIQKAIRDDDFLVARDVVDRVVSGWLVGDVVVLVGPTGSGKTSLARLLARAFGDIVGNDRFFSTVLEVTPDYDIAQFLGYENLAGEYTAGNFASEALFVGEPSDPRIVILDEWNLAQIDSYFAPVLSAVEADISQPLPGRLAVEKYDDIKRRELERAQPDAPEGRWRLPEDTLFIATCNSWMEEPETRLPISGPVKRRCRIVQIPNALSVKLQEEGRDGLVDACNRLLARERVIVDTRRHSSRKSMFDEHRAGCLERVKEVGDLAGDASDILITLSRVLLETPQTEQGFTPGILRDLLLSCVYAPEGGTTKALGQEIADKLLHQIQGDPHILEVIRDTVSTVPNAEEIETLMRRMGGLGEERRIRPLI